MADELAELRRAVAKRLMPERRCNHVDGLHPTTTAATNPRPQSAMVEPCGAVATSVSGEPAAGGLLQWFTCDRHRQPISESVIDFFVRVLEIGVVVALTGCAHFPRGPDRCCACARNAEAVAAFLGGPP